jgi:hypothetical protein
VHGHHYATLRHHSPQILSCVYMLCGKWAGAVRGEWRRGGEGGV